MVVLAVILAVIGCVAAAALGLIARWFHHRRTARQVTALYQAAVAGERAELRQWVERGRPIDLRDREGNSALHLAYYRGRRDAVDALAAYGADANLRNNEGLSAPEMGVVAAIEDQLDAGVRCLDGRGGWADEKQGRILYDRLKRHQPRLYNPALVRRALTGRDRRGLLRLAIKLGVRGSEQRLAQVLYGYGTQEMAVDYLNAGSAVLREAAERWARRHNYRIVHLGGRAVVSWGRF